MKKILGSLILFLPLIVRAQGIQWAEGLSWEQVKQKAMQENKYIFLDCFTTWCGPCKRMDREVYTNDTVGNYYNRNFISVKVQMDKTKNDNDYIKSWYRQADSIGKWYIKMYPSFLFLSPQGKIVYIDEGYKPSGKFVAVGQTATKPGQVYNDWVGEYENLVNEYKQGIKHWDRMPFMIEMAYKSGQPDFGKQLLHEHTDYVATLPSKERYTKENIELWAEKIPGLILGSNGLRFRFFYEDGKIIDKVMHRRGYAAKVVDKTIENEILYPFYKTQRGGEIMAPGLMRIGGKADNTEADWKKLYTLIREKFNKTCARRNVLNAKVAWYNKHHQYDLFVKYALKKLSVISMDSLNLKIVGEINNIGWTCFLGVTDKKTLIKPLPYIEKAIRQWPPEKYRDHRTVLNIVDTYANLLYKIGRRSEAIEWEEKVAMLNPKDEDYRKVVEQMKNGEPTYVEWGAVWK